MPRPFYLERKLTELDFARLKKLALADPSSDLAELLGEAEVVDAKEMPHDVVTMYASVEIEDLGTHRRQTVVVCYPGDAQPSLGFISVLSPVGTSLLGLQSGSIARWRTPNGEDHAAEVIAILFQPEAAGDYVT